jgi:hypothetical protein
MNRQVGYSIDSSKESSYFPSSRSFVESDIFQSDRNTSRVTVSYQPIVSDTPTWLQMDQPFSSVSNHGSLSAGGIQQQQQQMQPIQSIQSPLPSIYLKLGAYHYGVSQPLMVNQTLSPLLPTTPPPRSASNTATTINRHHSNINNRNSIFRSLSPISCTTNVASPPYPLMAVSTSCSSSLSSSSSILSSDSQGKIYSPTITIPTRMVLLPTQKWCHWEEDTQTRREFSELHASTVAPIDHASSSPCGQRIATTTTTTTSPSHNNAINAEQQTNISPPPLLPIPLPNSAASAVAAAATTTTIATCSLSHDAGFVSRLSQYDAAYSGIDLPLLNTPRQPQMNSGNKVVVVDTDVVVVDDEDAHRFTTTDLHHRHHHSEKKQSLCNTSKSVHFQRCILGYLT